MYTKKILSIYYKQDRHDPYTFKAYSLVKIWGNKTGNCHTCDSAVMEEEQGAVGAHEMGTEWNLRGSENPSQDDV